MPKVRASLADVSTDYTPIDPGTYEVQINDVEEKVQEDDRVVYIISGEVKGLIEDGSSIPSDYDGRKFKDFIHIHKRDGDLNEVGLVQLKRWAEAVVGERANEEDFDTDEIKNGRVAVTLKVDEYEGKKNNKVSFVSEMP